MALSKQLVIQSPFSADELEVALNGIITNRYLFFEPQQMLFRGWVTDQEFYVADKDSSPKTPTAHVLGSFKQNQSGTYIKAELVTSRQVEGAVFGFGMGLIVPILAVPLLMFVIYGHWFAALMVAGGCFP